MSNRSKSLIILLLIALAQTAFSYARFQWFIDQNINPADDPGGESTGYYFGPGSHNGAIFSNDYIWITAQGGEYPQFYGPVATARGDVIWLGGTIPDYGIFHGGLLVNFPDHNGFPLPTAASIIETCGVGLAISSIPALIDSLDSWEEIATTIRIRGNMLRIYQWLYNHFSPNGDTIFFENRYEYGQHLSLPSPQNGIARVTGKLLLEGNLTGQLTILATDTVWLIDDVYYSDVAFDGVNWIGNPPEDEKGRPPQGSNNRLAIISEKNVIIAFTPENGGYNGDQSLPGCDAVEGAVDRQHILITAAIMALDNVFEVDFWHNSCTDGGNNPHGLPTDDPCNTGMNDLRGSIYLWGSIIQQRHGYTRRRPIGPYGNRMIGYDKRYHFDENFLESFPPCFPMLWDTLDVPEEFPRIQNAIDFAGFNDLILVSPGYYPENLMIDGKRIALTSRYLIDGDVSRIEETIIAGVEGSSVINIQNGVYPFSRISGFTLTNGSGFQDDSSEVALGGAVHCVNSAPLLEDLLINENSADYGGAIYLSESPLYLTLRRSTLTDNNASAGGAIYCSEHGRLIMDNCILWDNTPDEIHADEDDLIVASCCDIQDGWYGWGIIDIDPMYCNSDWEFYRLQLDSPCRTDVCGFMGYTGETCDGEGVEEPITEPSGFYLAAAYPNPFNPSTTVEYSLAAPGDVTLSIYNIQGQLVDVIHEEYMTAGRYTATWTPNNLSSGIYFVELRAGTEWGKMKMMYVK